MGEESKQLTETQNNISIEIIISNDNLFNEKKNALKDFSAHLPAETNLPTVPTEGGLFGWFDHNVTGDELNRLTESIQKRMIEQNITIVKVIQEFAAIYDTFSALDKVYIQEILIALNAAIKANEKANENIEKINEQQKEISVAQQDIKQMINQQKQIIQVLKNYKEKLEKFKHLNDIDKIYSNSLSVQTKIETLEKISAEQKISIEKFFKRYTDFEMSLSKLKESSDQLSLKLSQSITENEQRFSEIERDIEKNQKEHIDKYDSFEVTLASVEQSVQDAYSKINDEIGRASKETENKYEVVQKDLAALRCKNTALSKSLIVSRIISATGLVFSIVLLILFLTGVLK